jgi:hypothetical protein
MHGSGKKFALEVISRVEEGEPTATSCVFLMKRYFMCVWNSEQAQLWHIGK